MVAMLGISSAAGVPFFALLRWQRIEIVKEIANRFRGLRFGATRGNFANNLFVVAGVCASTNSAIAIVAFAFFSEVQPIGTTG